MMCDGEKREKGEKGEKEGKDERKGENERKQGEQMENTSNRVDELISFVHNINHLETRMIRLDNVHVNFELDTALNLYRAATMLTTPLVHVAFEFSELYVKHLTNFHPVSFLPPVDDDFCSSALLAFSSEFHILGDTISRLLRRPVGIFPQPQFIKVSKCLERCVKLDPVFDYLLVAAHNNCAHIKFTSDSVVCDIGVEDLHVHALLLAGSNRIEKSRIDFVGGELSSSLFFLFRIETTESSVNKEDVQKRQEQREEVQRQEQVQKRCYLERELDEALDPNSELVAIASVIRRMRRTNSTWKRVSRLRRDALDLTNDLDEMMDCDYASLNRELKRKRSLDDGESDSEHKKKRSSSNQSSDSLEDETTAKDEKDNGSKISNRNDDYDDNGKVSEDSFRLPSSASSGSSTSVASVYHDILTPQIALITHHHMAYSTDHFYYTARSLYKPSFLKPSILFSPFNKQVFLQHLKECSQTFTHVLLVPSKNIPTDFLSTTAMPVFFDLASRNTYAVPGDGDIFQFLSTLHEAEPLVSKQANILLVFPHVLDDGNFKVVKPPNLVYFEARLVNMSDLTNK